MKINMLLLLFLAGITVYSCQSSETPAAPEKIKDSTPVVQVVKSENLKAIVDSNVTRMSRLPLTNNPTKDFALIMRVHHDGAEKLIKAAMKFNKDSALAKLAMDIQKDLDKETVILNRFIIDRRFKKEEQESAVSNTLVKSITPNAEPSATLTGDVEEDFVHLMITNLQSANDLVEVMKNAGADVEVSGFTKEMVPRNEKYIEALKEWSAKEAG